MNNPITTMIKLARTEKLASEAQKDIDTMNKSNWKTNTFGIVGIVFAIAITWAPAQYTQKLVTTQNEIAGIAGLLGVGLLAAKDHDN